MPTRRTNTTARLRGASTSQVLAAAASLWGDDVLVGAAAPPSSPPGSETLDEIAARLDKQARYWQLLLGRGDSSSRHQARALFTAWVHDLARYEVLAS